MEKKAKQKTILSNRKTSFKKYDLTMSHYPILVHNFRWSILSYNLYLISYNLSCGLYNLIFCVNWIKISTNIERHTDPIFDGSVTNHVFDEMILEFNKVQIVVKFKDKPWVVSYIENALGQCIIHSYVISINHARHDSFPYLRTSS